MRDDANRDTLWAGLAAGARLTGVVRGTWLAGAPVTEDGPRPGLLLASGEA